MRGMIEAPPAVTAATPSLAGINLDVRVRCRLCGDTLHPVANGRLDEWSWADQSGSAVGLDADLRQLPGGDPFARLDELTARMKASRYRDHAAALEYSALTIRLGGVGGGDARMHHVHWPEAHDPIYSGPVPECCSWPGWLRPSGWQCRQCGRRLGPALPPTIGADACAAAVGDGHVLSPKTDYLPGTAGPGRYNGDVARAEDQPASIRSATQQPRDIPGAPDALPRVHVISTSEARHELEL